MPDKKCELLFQLAQATKDSWKRSTNCRRHPAALAFSSREALSCTARYPFTASWLAHMSLNFSWVLQSSPQSGSFSFVWLKGLPVAICYHFDSFCIWTVCGKFPVKRGDTRLHQLDFNGLHVCRESVLPKETSLHGICFGFNLAHWQQAGQREICTRVLVWAHVCSVAHWSCCVRPDTMTWGQGIGRMLSHASKAIRGEICPFAHMLVLRATSASVLVKNQISVNAGQLCL